MKKDPMMSSVSLVYLVSSGAHSSLAVAMTATGSDARRRATAHEWLRRGVGGGFLSSELPIRLRPLLPVLRLFSGASRLAAGPSVYMSVLLHPCAPPPVASDERLRL